MQAISERLPGKFRGVIEELQAGAGIFEPSGAQSLVSPMSSGATFAFASEGAPGSLPGTKEEEYGEREEEGEGTDESDDGGKGGEAEREAEGESE